jgi:hypothetical protein
MSPVSTEISPGDYIYSKQYNDLRDDILDVVNGHGHSGVNEDGKIIYARAYVSDTAPTIPFAGMIWVDTSE